MRASDERSFAGGEVVQKACLLDECQLAPERGGPPVWTGYINSVPGKLALQGRLFDCTGRLLATSESIEIQVQEPSESDKRAADWMQNEGVLPPIAASARIRF